MSTDLLLIAGSFAPREGGAERQLRTVLADYSRQGYQVHVVTQMIPDSDVRRRETIDGIRVRRLGSRMIYKYLPRIGGVSFLIGATLYSLRLGPRTVLSTQLGAATIAGSFTSAIQNVPHIIRLAGGGTAQYKSEPFSRQASILGRLIFRLISRRRTIVVAPAKHLLEDFMECVPSFPGHTQHIMNGVEKKSTDGLQRKRQIVWYSRWGSEKSYATFKSIVGLLPSVPFVVIGHFDEANVPSNVTSLGWQEHPELVLAESQVLLNTSPSEGMPNTVLQAIAHGCRVVGFSNEGMREVYAMFPNSVQLAENSDSGAIATYLREALDNDQPVNENVPTSSTVFAQWKRILPTKRITE